MTFKHGWLKREFQSASNAVRKWPAWAHNLRVPHYLRQREDVEKVKEKA